MSDPLAPAPGGTWTRVARDADLSPEQPFAVRARGVQIALVRLADGVFAINDICTHDYALLSDGWCEDGKLECPLHQACFDVRTGRALNEPATVDAKTYPVKVEGGEVFVQLPA